jgi:chemotaxis protein CheX
MKVQPRKVQTVSCKSAIVACIQITGAWNGTVALHCPTPLARQVAAAMFSVKPDEITGVEMQDSLGELVNMLGGNLKALLPEPCQLSLPAVIEGMDYMVRIFAGLPINQLAFSCQEYPLLVTILERTERSL